MLHFTGRAPQQLQEGAEGSKEAKEEKSLPLERWEQQLPKQEAQITTPPIWEPFTPRHRRSWVRVQNTHGTWGAGHRGTKGYMFLTVCQRRDRETWTTPRRYLRPPLIIWCQSPEACLIVPCTRTQQWLPQFPNIDSPHFCLLLEM